MPGALISLRDRVQRGSRVAANLPVLRSGASPMRWNGIGGHSGASQGYVRRVPLFHWLLPGTHLDYRVKAGDLWKNSAAGIALNWITMSFPEAPFCVMSQPKADGTVDYFPAHALSALLRRPNSRYGYRQLVFATLISYLCDGNAYWLKVRNNAGEVAELWYVPHYEMEPRWPEDGQDEPGKPDSGYISYYERFLNGQWTRIETGDVVHFRYGMDPDNTRKGLAPLKAQLRQVFSDNENSTYIASILENAGICSLVISAASPDIEMDDEEAERNKKVLYAKTTGDERGKPIVVPYPIKVDRLAFSPEEMALDKMMNQPVSRICGALLVDAMVLGLPSESNTHYDNREQAERGAWNNGIIPWMAMLSGDIEYQLLPEFGGVNGAGQPGLTCGFDTRNVRALQPDEDKRFARYVNGYRGGVLTRGDSRAALGLPYDEKTDAVYITDIVGQQAPEENPGGATAAEPGAKAVRYRPDAPDDDDAPDLWVRRYAQELKALEAVA